MANIYSVASRHLSVNGRLVLLALAVSASPMARADQAADAAAEENSGALAEVVVTAHKREESSREVPATIDVVSGDQLAKLGISDLFKLAIVMPGMVFSRAPDDGLGLTFRGLGTPARTQSFDQSIALFLDGTFIGKGRMYSAAFFDVARVELIKGTESTLLGKNTSLGAITLISHKPGDGDYVSAGYEVIHGGPTIDGAFDIPVSEALKFRVAAHYVDTDGWVKNITTGNEGPHDIDRDVRLTGALNPSDGIRVSLEYQFSNDQRIGNGYEFVDPDHVLPPSYGPGVLGDQKASYVSEGDRGESVHATKAHVASATVDADIGNLTLTSISAYAKYALAFVDDFDFGPKDATYFVRHEDYHQISEELRVASPSSGSFSYLGGVFLFHSNWNSSETQIYDTPVAIPPGTIFQGGFTNNFTQATSTESAFGSVTYRFTDDLRINAGLRYTHESKQAAWGRPAIAPFTFWNQVVNPPFATTPLPFSEGFVNGNVSLQYDVTGNVMAYVGYGRGTKTGGFAESAAVSSGNPALPSDAGGSAVKSETANSVETGIKSALLNHSLDVNAALFFTKVTNFQNTSFTGSSFDTSNVDVRSYGVEAEVAWQIARAWRLDTAWTYAHSRIVAPYESLLAEAPEFTGHVGLTFEQPLSSSGWKARISPDYRYRGSMVHQTVLSFRSEPYRPVDLTVALISPSDRLQLSLIGRNLNNSLSADFSAPPADPTVGPNTRVEAPSPLRAITLQARYQF